MATDEGPAFPTAHQSRDKSHQRQAQLLQSERGRVGELIERAVLRGEYHATLSQVSEPMQAFLTRHGYQVQPGSDPRDTYFTISWR